MGNFITTMNRELRFALRDNVVLVTLIASALLSTVTILNGLKEITNERDLIERVDELVTQDRQYSLASQTDAGGAAYYAFHFTYDPPSPLAFASRGVRDDLPWKHRIRMLALEGQIYENDRGNPELSRVGKLDYAFVVAFLLPLLLILLLYDLRANEVRNNRWTFLSATSGSGGRLLIHRAALRSCLLYFSIVVPFIVFAAMNGVKFGSILVIMSAVAFNILLWFLIALFMTSRIESGPITVALLLGVWFIVAVAVPVGGKLIVESIISVPQGGKILLTQRENVNGAWDLPKEKTMQSFVARYPKWSDFAEVQRPFEWKWYFAFQQMGDLSVELLSNDFRAGVRQRDRAMGLVSLVSPSLLTERILSQAANTDVSSFQRYDSCVRDFHARLREFHYPMLFGQTDYSRTQISKLPSYSPCSHSTKVKESQTT